MNCRSFAIGLQFRFQKTCKKKSWRHNINMLNSCHQIGKKKNFLLIKEVIFKKQIFLLLIFLLFSSVSKFICKWNKSVEFKMVIILVIGSSWLNCFVIWLQNGRVDFFLLNRQPLKSILPPWPWYRTGRAYSSAGSSVCRIQQWFLCPTPLSYLADNKITEG